MEETQLLTRGIYSAEEHETWAILFERNKAQRLTNASSAFLDALDQLQISPNHIPNIDKLNENLSQLTGWRIELVDGLVEESDFFKLLFNKKYPIVHNIRKRQEIDYTDMPDIFHDLYGHIPLVCNRHYNEFLNQLSVISTMYDYNEFIVTLLARAYWYTIETGLVREHGELKIYGAAVISSYAEAQNVFKNDIQKQPFDIGKIVQMPFSYDIQERYFVLDSFEQLSECIEDLHIAIENQIQK